MNAHTPKTDVEKLKAEIAALIYYLRSTDPEEIEGDYVENRTGYIMELVDRCNPSHHPKPDQEDNHGE